MTRLGAGGALAGCALGLAGAFPALLGAAPTSVRLPWDVPGGAFYVELDALAAAFLVPIFVVCAAAAIYGAAYLRDRAADKALGPAWLFFDLLVAGMALVVIARNGVLFLVAWEVMSLSAYFLVTFDHEKESVRAAGWTYLIATHAGTAFLLVFFVLFGCEAGSLDFDRFAAASAAGALSPSTAGTLFALALVGFGTKAGLIPLHVWLPEAHPAAPSHVSAVMSGVMIKIGIYGLVRALTLLGAPPAWWGWTLVALGVSSGVCGVLFALAQHELKRLLAYHSVENIGIITMGLGLGVLGAASGSPALAALGYGGALLHGVNHALFKGLLFLSAGAVLHAAGTGEIERLGGLLRRMPRTGVAFLVGAVAITGLPPLNGFTSEFLVYLGALRGTTSLERGAALPSLAVIAAMALIAGLAAACFLKAFGVVFLGVPRSAHGERAHDPGRAMTAPMLALAAACAAIGLAAPLVVPALAPAVRVASGLPPAEIEATLAGAASSLWMVVGATLALAALAGALALLRRRLLRDRPVASAVTWDCGYAQPTPRMQYTASSFAQPLTSLFSALLGTRMRVTAPRGYFPREASLASETRDPWREGAYRPLYASVTELLSSLRWLQHGHIHLYILNIALTLIALLLWKLA
ncbi:MAG: proton-conducting transporter membrane subunit [Myxococcota bacterium]